MKEKTDKNKIINLILRITLIITLFNTFMVFNLSKNRIDFNDIKEILSKTYG
ncbi:MAG: hypothetical protein KQA41_03575 [Candidatus Aenigmarchaeota archaeon]|nr:hypothetical protein [Candidatus Aenigmarchaeota archaeon]